MDGPSRTINPACVRSRRTQASKGLGKMSTWVQALLQYSAVSELGTHCREWPAETNSKAYDIMMYMNGSVTRDRFGWGFTVKQGGKTVHEDSGSHGITTSSLTMEVEAVTYAIQWLGSQRDAQITHMPSFSQTQWTSCKRWSQEWAALTGTQPCIVFRYKDFCRSAVLGRRESEGMNGQIDWQAQQISHLVCSLTGQRCSEAWGIFWTWTGQSITALITWRKEEWRKEAADIPPFKVENDLCLTRQILALLRGQPWGDCWQTGRSAYGPFRVLRRHLEVKLKLYPLAWSTCKKPQEESGVWS